MKHIVALTGVGVVVKVNKELRERFINPERVSAPDIDLDLGFTEEKSEGFITKAKDCYGQKHKQ